MGQGHLAAWFAAERLAAAEAIPDSLGAIFRGGRGRLTGLEAFRIKNNKATGAFAGGCCGEAGFCQRQVKDTTLARGHRSERKRATGSTDLLYCHFGHKIQLAIAGGLETFGVEGDAVVIFGFKTENLGGDVFDGVKKFAVAGHEQGGIGTGKLDCDLGSGIGRVGGFW